MVGGSKIKIMSEHVAIALCKGFENVMEVLKYLNLFLIIILIILFYIV